MHEFHDHWFGICVTRGRCRALSSAQCRFRDVITALIDRFIAEDDKSPYPDVE